MCRPKRPTPTSSHRSHVVFKDVDRGYRFSPMSDIYLNEIILPHIVRNHQIFENFMLGLPDPKSLISQCKTMIAARVWTHGNQSHINQTSFGHPQIRLSQWQKRTDISNCAGKGDHILKLRSLRYENPNIDLVQKPFYQVAGSIRYSCMYMAPIGEIVLGLSRC